MVSSALEAYAVPHGKKHDEDGHTPLETYGSVWGYVTEKCGHTYFHVVAADPETSADRKPGSVLAKVASSRVKGGFYGLFSPELGYLGDFHSHPYSQGEYGLGTAQHVEKRRYYRFSGIPGDKSGDFASVRSLKAQGLQYRVGIVVTIFKMKNKVIDPLHGFLDRKSAVRFTYSGSDAKGVQRSFRCWIKAYTFLDADDKPTADAHVRIQCGALGLVPWV